MHPVTPIKHHRSVAALAALFLAFLSAGAQDAPHRALPPLPPPLGVPKPGPATDAPYAPQPILPGGVVVTLYPPGSPYLKMDRVREPEVYNMSQSVPGRINSIVNIHNPSIEVHTVDRGINTGAAVILAAGGGHNTLNVGSEAADFVPFFYNYGVTTVILRTRSLTSTSRPGGSPLPAASSSPRATSSPSTARTAPSTWVRSRSRRPPW